MARMLQALKNLEARSPAKPAPKAKAAAPRAPVVDLEPSPQALDRSVESPGAPTVAPSVPAVTESIDALAGHLASLEISVQDPPGRFESGKVSARPFIPPAPKAPTTGIPSFITKPPVPVPLDAP